MHWHCILMLLLCPLLGATGQASSMERALDPIRVSEHQQSLSASQIDVARYSGFVRQVERAEFNTRFVSLADVLNHQLGVQVRQQGGWGGYTTLSVRGSASKQLALFIDGVPFQSVQSAAANLSLIPLSMIERIDIYPDFTPVQLGSANISGAINVVTRNTSSTQSQLALRSGSFGALGASGAWLGGGDTLRLALGVEHLQADNDYAFNNTGNTPDNASNHFRDKRVNNDLAQHVGFVKADYRFSPDSRMEWLLQIADYERAIPTPQNRPSDQGQLTTRFWQASTLLATQYGDWQADHGVSFGDEHSELADPTARFVGVSELSVSNSRRWATRHVAALLRKRQQWRVTLDLQQETFTQAATLRRLPQAENARLFVNLGAQFDWQSTDSYWHLTTLFKQFWWQDKTRQFELFGEEGFHERDEDQGNSWHLAIQYQWLPTLRWKANVARAVRIPTLFERFGELGSTRPNDELRPETSLNLETGLVWEWQALTLMAAWFAKQSQDHIVLSVDTSGRGKLLNFGETVSQGIEARIDWTWGSEWLVTVGGVWMDTENRVQIKAFQGKPLPGVYHRQAFASLRWTQGDYVAQLAYAHDSDMNYDPSAAALADAKNRWDFSVTRYWLGWTLSMQVSNVLNQQAMDFNRFQNPGRAWYLSLSYDWI